MVPGAPWDSFFSPYTDIASLSPTHPIPGRVALMLVWEQPGSQTLADQGFMETVMSTPDYIQGACGCGTRELASRRIATH